MTTRTRIMAGMLTGVLALSMAAACSANSDEETTPPRGGAVTGDSTGGTADLGSPTEEMQDASIEPSSLFGETAEEAMEGFARALNAGRYETAVGYMSPYAVLDMTSEVSTPDPVEAIQKMLTWEKIMESGGVGGGQDESAWEFVTREDGAARGGSVTRVMNTEGSRGYFGAPMMETADGWQVDQILYERLW